MIEGRECRIRVEKEREKDRLGKGKRERVGLEGGFRVRKTRVWNKSAGREGQV